MTHDARRSGSSSIPANLCMESNIVNCTINSPFSTPPKHPLDDLRDLLGVDGAAAVRVESREDPVELLLDGGHVLHVGGLEPLEEVEGAAAVLVKHPEQGVVEDIVLVLLDVGLPGDVTLGVLSVEFFIRTSYFLSQVHHNQARF